MLAYTKELFNNKYFKVTYADGTHYEGHFRDDKKNGLGVYYDANNNVLDSGEWIEDDCIRTIPVEKTYCLLDEE